MMTEENSHFYNPNQAIIYPLEPCNDSITICPTNDAQPGVHITNYIYENESEEICRCGPNSIFLGCSCERLYPRNDWSFHNSTNRLSRNTSEAGVALTPCTQNTSTTDLTQPTVLSLPRDVNQELKMSRKKRYSKRRKVNVNGVLKHIDTRDSSPESIDTPTRREATRKPPKKKLRSNKSQSDERHDDNPSSIIMKPTQFHSQSSIDLTSTDSNGSKVVCRKSARLSAKQTDATRNIKSQSTTIYVNTTNAEKLTQSSSRSRRDLSSKVDYHESINLSGIQSDSACTKNLSSTSMNAILSKSSSPSPIVLIPKGISDSNNVFDKSASLASQLDTTSNNNLPSSSVNAVITILTKSSSTSPIVLFHTDVRDSNKVGYKSACLVSQSDTSTSSQLHTVSNLTVAVSDSRPVLSKEFTNNVSGLHDENQSLSITEAPSTSSVQTHSIFADSNEFEDYCSCRNCSRSKRCVCVRATKRCNPSCNCKDCDNPLNILEAYDVNIEIALKDECLRSIMYKVKHLELFLDRSVRIGCCQGVVRLLDCIPGKKSCPHCNAQIQYSWCRGVVCVESMYPRKHCAVCNKCSIVERDIYCSCLSKPKLSITNSSRENKN